MYIETKEIGPEGLFVDRVMERVPPLPLEGDRQVPLGRTHLSGELMREQEGVSFSGDVETVATLECSRCLEPYDLPLELHFDLLYTTAPEPDGKRESRVDEDDIPRVQFDGRRIDLSQLLAEQVYLAVPLKPLCREECGGLCPHCGINRNEASCNCRETRAEDPRLLGLKKLL